MERLSDLQPADLTLNECRSKIIGTNQLRAGSRAPSDFADHLRTQGVAHVCFIVDDVDTAMRELNRRDVRLGFVGEEATNTTISFDYENEGTDRTKVFRYDQGVLSREWLVQSLERVERGEPWYVYDRRSI